MPYLKKIIFVSLILTFTLLAGCFQSEEEVMREAEKIIKAEFLSKEKVDTNYETTGFNLYKPEELAIEEEEKNTIVFNNGDRPYVLFINEFEPPNSQWSYDRLKNNNQDIFLRTFQSEEQFAYLGIIEHEDNQYEIQLGIGGIKMSTLSNIDSLVSDVDMMMQIVKSVEKK